jgi:hypothetical protein
MLRFVLFALILLFFAHPRSAGNNHDWAPKWNASHFPVSVAGILLPRATLFS